MSCFGAYVQRIISHESVNVLHDFPPEKKMGEKSVQHGLR